MAGKRKRGRGGRDVGEEEKAYTENNQQEDLVLLVAWKYHSSLSPVYKRVLSPQGCKSEVNWK